ncbi:hypothetical protein [Rivibacter subsaxonicus]|uniref:Type II/III secretion system protein n=1 Tax=Rivibacter subsaxonicus TaxID=457575 RepID=A0A4Q7VXQ4_9BURK|nr:hypothetical protein [Rivibacter subsaxonicus]RZU01189.1 hypothetical protein EV670_1905 [Rivibacter subsaxonicus]
MLLRRGLLLALPAFIGLAALAQEPRLPLRNLLVEVRQGESARLGQQSAGIDSARVAIGSDGSVRGAADATLAARSQDSGAQAQQQLRVLNGGSASIGLGSSTPLQWLSWVWTPGGPKPVGTSLMVDTGRSVVVRPSWPGGDAPVTVELRSDASSLGRDGSVARATTLSTVAVPLGQWITVARSSEAGQQTERGLLSTQSGSSSRDHVVQLRVTAP